MTRDPSRNAGVTWWRTHFARQELGDVACGLMESGHWYRNGKPVERGCWSRPFLIAATLGLGVNAL